MKSPKSVRQRPYAQAVDGAGSGFTGDPQELARLMTWVQQQTTSGSASLHDGGMGSVLATALAIKQIMNTWCAE